MYTVPYGADYFISRNPARGYCEQDDGNGDVKKVHGGGGVGEGGILSLGPSQQQLPAFNAAFNHHNSVEIAASDNNGVRSQEAQHHHNSAHRGGSGYIVVQETRNTTAVQQQGHQAVNNDVIMQQQHQQQRWQAAALAAGYNRNKAELPADAYQHRQHNHHVHPNVLIRPPPQGGPHHHQQQQAAFLPTVPASALVRRTANGEAAPAAAAFVHHHRYFPTTTVVSPDGRVIRVPQLKNYTNWDRAVHYAPHVQQQEMNKEHRGGAPAQNGLSFQLLPGGNNNNCWQSLMVGRGGGAISIDHRSGNHQGHPQPPPPPKDTTCSNMDGLIRSREEKEAAEALAEFSSLSTDFVDNQRRTINDTVNGQISVTRQPHRTVPTIPDGKMEQKVVLHFPQQQQVHHHNHQQQQQQQQQQLQSDQMKNHIPAIRYVGTGSGAITNVDSLQQQQQQQKYLLGGAVDRTPTLIHQPMINTMIIGNHQSQHKAITDHYGHKQVLVSSPPKAAPYGGVGSLQQHQLPLATSHQTVVAPVLSSSSYSSSSLFRFVNEFIRQMDPNTSDNVGPQEDVQQQQNYQQQLERDAATAVALANNMVRVDRSYHSVSLPSSSSLNPAMMMIRADQPVINNYHAAATIDTAKYRGNFNSAFEPFGNHNNNAAVGTTPKIPTEHLKPFPPPDQGEPKCEPRAAPAASANLVVQQQQQQQQSNHSANPQQHHPTAIANSSEPQHRAKYAPPLLKTNKNKNNKKSNNGLTVAAMKIQKRLKLKKAAAKILPGGFKKQQRRSAAVIATAATISELKLPVIKESGPLSLSTVGLLAHLVKTTSLIRRLVRKQQIRRKNGGGGGRGSKISVATAAFDYYDRLPTIFGPVAASLSLSNGATVAANGSNNGDAVSKTPQLPPPAQSQSQPSATAVPPIFTNGKKHVFAKIPVAKQQMATPLSDRIPLPDGSLESEESLKNRLENNIVQPVHKCGCISDVNEDIEGAYYTHLAAAPSMEKMRSLLEERYKERGPAIRIEKVRFTNREGKTPDGCPIAKWVIRRSGPEEKILCVVRQRPHHFCSTAVMAIIIVIWDGVPKDQADDLYTFLIRVLPEFGLATNRRCETNEKRSCACQGMNERSNGASFSFGCSWSMYSNTCKFCKSRGDVRKFKLQPQAGPELEAVLENKCHNLADSVAPVFKSMAPACYRNQTYYSEKAQSCRLGYIPRGPFSGITACVDFCAHAHKDIHNMNNGCTVVVTLTKHRGFEKPNDEQLHVLPLCVLESTDEFGSEENQWRKAQNGSLEVLNAYPMHLRLRTKSLPSCKERTKQQRQQRLNGSAAAKAKCMRVDAVVMRQQGTSEEMNDFQSIRNNGANINSGLMVDPRSTAAVPHPSGQFGGGPPPYDNGPATNRLPSVHTFSQYYNNNSCSSQSSSMPGVGGYPNGAGVNYYDHQAAPVVAAASYHQQPCVSSNNDLVGFSQGFRTPTSVFAAPAAVKRAAGCDGGGGANHDASIYVSYTDNREAFDDPRVGGVAVALSHGSVLLEVAKRELHATTALKTPDRRDPKRISLVFYQHKHLNYVSHGAEEHEKKVAERNGRNHGAGVNGGDDEDEEDENNRGGGKLGSPSDEDDDDQELGKGQDVVRWPSLEPVKTSGEWSVVGANNLCTTRITDTVSTACSGTCECNPTQKYAGRVLTTAASTRTEPSKVAGN